MARILVVDDEPYILRSLTFTLRQEGHEVSTANNGTDALDMLLGEPFDIAFLDIMMPALSGFDVVRSIKNTVPDLPTKLIFLTAKGMDADRQEGLELGAYDFLTKPFSPLAIATMVKDICTEGDQTP